MMQVTEIPTGHLVRALRVYVTDLSDTQSPFNKDDHYLKSLAGWIACAATRLETLNAQPVQDPQPEPPETHTIILQTTAYTEEVNPKSIAEGDGAKIEVQAI